MAHTDDTLKTFSRILIIYRGIKNRAAITGHEQLIIISTMHTSRDVAKY